MQALYMFRKPKFPLIINFEFEVIGISAEKYLSQLSFDKLEQDKLYDTIDFTGEGFGFGKKDSDAVYFTPLTFKKDWKKKELITLYNTRKNKTNEIFFIPEKSAESKTKSKIISEIVSLLNKEASIKYLNLK